MAPPRLVLLLLAGLAMLPLPLAAEPPALIPPGQLEEDLRQLADILETAHPDPYLRGGGKVAFNRRLHAALRALPTSGLTASGFFEIAQPFVAAVQDGHTKLRRPDGVRGARVPIGFRVIGDELIVVRVYDEAHRRLIGARLTGAESVPYTTLLERQGRLRGYDNRVHNLRNLSLSLARADRVAPLLPAWGEPDTLHLQLQLEGGGRETIALALQPELPELIEPESAVTLPSTERAAQAFGFTDESRRTCILRIDHMMGYREAFELNHNKGFKGALNSAPAVYRRFHDKEPPADLEELIGGLPSATELLSEMVVSMKDAGTRTLVVDLRRNTGGNSVISSIVLYFLYGKTAMMTRDSGYQIRKYSELYFENYQSMTMEVVNERRTHLLEPDDYDFERERSYREEGGEQTAAELAELTGEYDAFFELIPSFQTEFRSGEHDGLYRPRDVVVLCSANTRSAGFNLLVDLYRQGARVVGTPSSQAGNCFIDSLGFELRHSGLHGTCSYKLSLLFPDDPAAGDVLALDVELDYETFSGFRFDRNADLLLALQAMARWGDE